LLLVETDDYRVQGHRRRLMAFAGAGHEART
jgi:hypothetical protein